MFTTAFLFRNHLTMKYSVHHPDQSTNTSFEYCLILYLKTVVKLANRLLLIKIINCHQFGLLIHGSSVSKKLNVQQPHVGPTPICYSLVINNYKVSLGLLALYFLFYIYIKTQPACVNRGGYNAVVPILFFSVMPGTSSVKWA